MVLPVVVVWLLIAAGVWDGGYLSFRFPNQGLCIAFVEHESH